MPECGKCGLDKLCKSPKMPVTGLGRRKILILGEAPGANEDDQNKQFVGESGNVLVRILHHVGLNLRKDCWLTNAVICRPWEHNKEGIVVNRTPDKEIGFCRPNLANTIARLKPEIIVPLGAVACESLMALAWKEGEVDEIGKWVGWQIPCIKLNAWICPTWHPASLLHEKTQVGEMLLTRHLRAMEGLKGRPWPDNNPPIYRNMVTMIYEPAKAADAIVQMMHQSAISGDDGLCSDFTPIAFDYETTMLKPESDRAKILSCALSNGKVTIAYPMVGEAVEATKMFLQSDVPKIAANLPFEDRWSRKKLKTIVRNWDWDILIGNHWLDCRHGINTVKFQSFVHLGADDYSYITDPDKGSKGGYSENRMKEVELSDLLLYNGLDALFEYLIAMKQKAKLPKTGEA